jgi:hypothetical protein
MPNLKIPIEEAKLWDILDKEVVEKRGAKASSNPDPTSRADALALLAKTLLDSKNQEEFFQDKARRFVGNATGKERRERAGALAISFGASPNRLISYLRLKGVM